MNMRTRINIRGLDKGQLLSTVKSVDVLFSFSVWFFFMVTELSLLFFSS